MQPRVFTLLICILFFLTNCSNKPNIKLEKVDFLENNPDVFIRWKNTQMNILILYVSEPKALGYSHDYLAFVKKTINSDYLIYKISNLNDGIRIAREKIYSVNGFDPFFWGWFNKDSKVKDSFIPLSENLSDSINKSYFNKVTISEINGYFHVYENGKQINIINYGNLVTDDKLTDFDILDHKLYKLEGKKLKKVSDNPNDFESAKDGLYFIPPPGYGILASFEISDIIKHISSVNNCEDAPDSFIIEGKDYSTY